MRWTLLATMLALPAYAQDPVTEPAPAESPPPAETIAVEEPAAPLPATDDTVALDALEVTAQRRVQRLVDVPVAVTAITQDQVEARGISRLDDLNSLAPGLQVSRSPSNTTISQLTIRGSSQINPAIYWDPAVGVYLDGVYIGKGQGAIFDVVDLAGVEVLRGPQGTLYGRNTIAGTINLVTREPSGKFAGNAAIEYGRYNQQVYRASIDLPTLGEFLDLNIGARSETREPTVETSPTSPVDGLNDRNSRGAHIGALFRITDGLEAMYHLDYSDTDQTNVFLQLVRYDSNMPAGTQEQVSKERRLYADIDSPSVEQAEVLGHSLIVTWSAAEWLTAKVIGGMREVTFFDALDLDGSPNDVAHSSRDTDYEQTSLDLNFSGQLGPVHYTVGAYWFTDEGFTDNPIHVLINGSVPLDFDSNYGTEAEAEALYGQVDWEVIEDLTLTAGARQTTETKGLTRTFGFSPDGANVPYTYQIPEGYRVPGAEFSATTPMGAIAYRWTDWLNTYLRYAEGFKSGGFNGEYSNVTGTPQEHEDETNRPFLPEQQQSWELGAKSSFMGGKVLFSAAAFQNKLEDLQVSIFTASGAAASVVRNAGKATVEGLELELAVAPFDGTTIRAHYAFLDTAYDEFIDAVCDPPAAPGGAPQNCMDENVADNRAFVHAPETAWNLVLDSEIWTLPFGTVRTTLDYAWTDSFYTYPYQLTGPGDTPCAGGAGNPRPCYDSTKQSAPDTEVPAYGILNARLALAGIPLGGTRLGEVALWARNALDEDSANNFIDFGPGFASLTVANFVEPASFGIAGIVRW